MFNGKPHYIFPLSTHAELRRGGEKRKLFRIIEFKHIYESLGIYVILQLENALNPETSIKIKGIDFWPEANYAEKYLNNALYLKFKNDMVGFEDDVLQWDRLHKLANESKKIYVKDKAYFNITDSKINNMFGLALDDIRFLLLRYEVPIKVKGIKTIDKVYIHTLKLVEALKKDIKHEYFYRNKVLYQHLITYLYDNCLYAEKFQIIDAQKSKFLEHFVIQTGDILQLKNGRIVVSSSAQIDSKNEIIIEYLILKVNLEVSERRRQIPFNDLAYILKKDDFLDYKNYTPSKRILLLDKWMSKRKKKIEFIKFESDLTVESD